MDAEGAAGIFACPAAIQRDGVIGTDDTPGADGSPVRVVAFHEDVRVMQPDRATITDIWFRSPLSLADLASAIGLTDAEYDSENHWEWVIGAVGGATVDVTRTHTQPPSVVDTRIFRPDLEPFTDEQKDDIVRRLRRIVPPPVTCGRWVYVRGEEFDLQVVETG